MKPKSMNACKTDEPGSIIVQTSLYDLIASVEREMGDSDDREVARTVSKILQKRSPRQGSLSKRFPRRVLPVYQ